MRIKLKLSNSKRKCPECGKRQVVKDERFDDFVCKACGWWSGDEKIKFYNPKGKQVKFTATPLVQNTLKIVENSSCFF